MIDEATARKLAEEIRRVYNDEIAKHFYYPEVQMCEPKSPGHFLVEAIVYRLMRWVDAEIKQQLHEYFNPE